MLRKPAIALALLATLASAVACGDDDDDPTGPAASTQLRVVHASPDAPNVDVLVDGGAVLTNIPYKTGSSYQAVQPGSRNIRVRATGTSTVVIDQTAQIAAGSSYTVIAAGRLASISPIILQDDLTAPAAGNAKVRLVHASPSAGNVDIYVTAPTADLAAATPVAANVAFRVASAYLAVPAGTYRVRVTPAGSKTVAIDVNSLAVAAGQIRTAIAVDAPGGGAPLGALLLTDAN